MRKIYLNFLFITLSLSLFSLSIDNNIIERELKVHKTPTCGCCKKWIEYMTNEGYTVSAEDHETLDKIKKCSKLANSLGIEVHAGHGLDYKTTKLLTKIKEIQ